MPRGVAAATGQQGVCDELLAPPAMPDRHVQVQASKTRSAARSSVLAAAHPVKKDVYGVLYLVCARAASAIVKVRCGAKGKLGAHSVGSEQPYTKLTQSRKLLRPVSTLARVGEHTVPPECMSWRGARVVCRMCRVRVCGDVGARNALRELVAARCERDCGGNATVTHSASRRTHLHENGALPLAPRVNIGRCCGSVVVGEVAPPNVVAKQHQEARGTLDD